MRNRRIHTLFIMVTNYLLVFFSATPTRWPTNSSMSMSTFSKAAKLKRSETSSKGGHGKVQHFYKEDNDEYYNRLKAKASKGKGGNSMSMSSQIKSSKSKASKCSDNGAPTLSPAPTKAPLPTLMPVLATTMPTPRPVEPTRKPTPNPTSNPIPQCVPLNPNPYTFDPPNNEFPIQPWTTGGDGVWEIDSNTPLIGTYSIRSPNFDGEPIKKVSNATLEVCDDFEGGPLIFYVMASVLPPQDVFIVYIDGVEVTRVADLQTFEMVGLTLGPGAHRVDFSYQYNMFNLDPESPAFENIPNRVLGAVWLDRISIGSEPELPTLQASPALPIPEEFVKVTRQQQPPCSVCGEGMEVGNPDASVSVPGRPGLIPCGILQNMGIVGLFSPQECDVLPSLISTDCECESSAAPTRWPTNSSMSMSTFSKAAKLKRSETSSKGGKCSL